MSTISSHLLPPPSSYSPLSPTDPNNLSGKDNASSTRSTRSSTFSIKTSRGFKKLFGRSGKDTGSPAEESRNAASLDGNPRVRSSRRDSETAARDVRKAMASSVSSPQALAGEALQGDRGDKGGFLYRSRNSRSLEALKLFSKSSTASSKNVAAPASRPRMLSGGSGGIDRPPDVIILSPSVGNEKTMPILQVNEEADEIGNGSTSTDSQRSTRVDPSFDMPRAQSKGNVDSEQTCASGIGGPPPPGAKGAVHVPCTPTRSTQPQSNVPHGSRPRDMEQDRSNHTVGSRPRPPKPNLSIPIPPRTSHEKAMSASAALQTQSPSAMAMISAHSQASSASGRPRMPPSPGLSLRVTPSIVMSRPVWPLPPLPPMPPDVPPIPTSASSGTSNNAATATPPSRILPRFRISPPTRSMTGPLTSSSNEADTPVRRAQSVRRSVSVKLNAMPSLNVMGETEHGDPEADDMMDEDEEDDMDDEEDHEIPMGRPSIDSMVSMDSMASVDTVRPPPDVEPSSSSSMPSTAVVPETKRDKGKGKEKRQHEPSGGDDMDGSASDSDDSVYFDARQSVIMSPHEVAKALERRHSQISQRNSMTATLFPSNSGLPQTPGARTRKNLDPLLDPHRDRRDSSWSFSTSGRESVYLTPSEGSTWSAAATPSHGGRVSTASDLASSAFVSEVSSKRSSVPVGFGATLGQGSLGSRRGASSRFSMVTAREQDGLPDIDSSAFKFDPASFGLKTPTSGVTSTTGLPPSRGSGLPNFDSAIPATAVTEPASEEPMQEANTPTIADYFGAARPPGSPVSQRRKPSLSIPAPIIEDANTPNIAQVSAAVSSSTSGDRPAFPKRPSVYRQASRSMVDISTSSMGMGDDEDTKVHPGTSVESLTLTSISARPANDALAWLVPPPSPAVTRPSTVRQNTLRKVSSFPLLQSGEMSSLPAEKPPPAYDSIRRREEEGKEILPPYGNDILLAGLLPRKMEFEQPGLQARDRSWKKVWCVLHGTMFRVYKVGTLETKFGALASAPVAGALPTTSATTILSGGRARGSTVTGTVSGSGSLQPRGSNAALIDTGPGVIEEDPAAAGQLSGKLPLQGSRGAESILTKNQHRASQSVNLLTPPSSRFPSSPSSSSTNTNSRGSGSSYAASRSSFSSSRPTTPARHGVASLALHSSGIGTAVGSKPVDTQHLYGHGPGGKEVIENGGTSIYTPMANALMRQYSLQGAESGLATDYIKRRNVIRIRMEGEQFLLQLPGVEEVVGWIEGFQAAANIALDLDTRPMPRGALYPRRRRRRRPRGPGEPATQSPLSPPPNIPGSGSGPNTPRSNASQSTPVPAA